MKEWYLSKTLWVNIIILVASVLVGLKVINVEIDPNAGWFTMVLSLVNMLLRFITKLPINWDSK